LIKVFSGFLRVTTEGLRHSKAGYLQKGEGDKEKKAEKVP